MHRKRRQSSQPEELLDENAPVSKSQRKRDMEGLQELGEELVKLDASSLTYFSMPESLRDAILEAQQITAHGGLRRQLQYIGKVMRNVDAELLQQQLKAFQDGSQTRKRYDSKIEQWRERLLKEANGLEALMQEFPQADKEVLQGLIEQAREEVRANEHAAIHDTHRTAVTPPAAFRKIYRILKELMPFSLLA